MRSYASGQHRFFDYVVAFIASLCCLGIGIAWHPSKRPYNPFYNRDRILKIQGISKVSNLEFRFRPYDLLESLYNNSWPSVIEFDESSLSGETTGMLSPKELNVTFQMHAIIIKSAFINYFESVRPIVEAKYGNNTQLWPGVWNFGRAVRNAFVHDGEINFDNSRAPAVTWKTLNYSPADNGRQILYRDLAAVEILILMEEMDAAV